MGEIPAPAALRAGKFPSDELARVLARVTVPHPRLLVGPRVGEDAAVIETGASRLVVASDPVTFVTERVGWYAVHVNANDIAVMGARPRWFLAAVLMPEGSSPAGVAAVLEDIGATCAGLGITLAGGHTEITAGIARPIVAGQMIGEAEEAEVVTKAGLRAGDEIVLTRGAAIEGTAILATEKRQPLERHLGSDLLARARRLLFDPGISIVHAARVAVGHGAVHAMHDPTEGGILAGLHELASAAGLGLLAWGERIPVLPETRAICDVLQIDPLSLIASGALLAACPPGGASALVDALAREGIPAAVVAEARPAGHGILLERGGRTLPFEPAPRDEIARVLA